MNILFYPPNKPELIKRIREQIPTLGILIAKSDEEVPAVIGEIDILVTNNRAYNEKAAGIIRAQGRRLKLIHFTTSGIDGGLKFGFPDNVPVTNSAGTHSNRIAQHAFALLLGVTRCLGDARESQKRHEWGHDHLARNMISLERATMVVLGLGAVGQEIARKAKAFDMRVIGISRSTAPLPNIDEIRPRDRLLETLAEADVIALATVYDETTHHMLDAKAFAVLKPRAVIVNVARGALIDEPVMIDALKTGRIAGAGIDVMAVEPLPADSGLWDLPNLVMTPHNANAGGDGQVDGIYAIIEENLQRMRAGEPLIKRVHGPDRVRQTA